MKIELVFFCFILVLKMVQAQEYTSFPTDSAEWTGHLSSIRNGGDKSITFWSLSLGKDTILNGKESVELIFTNRCRKEVNNMAGIDTIYYVRECFSIGAIREFDKKVYFYKYEEVDGMGMSGCSAYDLKAGEEHLLYDFSMEIGDTVELSNSIIFYKEGEEEDQEGRTHHKMKSSLLPQQGIEWIEGVGSPFGLFGPYVRPLNYIGSPYKTCLTIRDTVSYRKGRCWECNPINFHDCQLITGTTNRDVKRMKIFPNPTNGEITLVSNSTYMRVKVFDPLGRMEQEVELSNQERKNIALKHRGVNLFLVQEHDGNLYFLKVLKL